MADKEKTNKASSTSDKKREKVPPPTPSRTNRPQLSNDATAQQQSTDSKSKKSEQKSVAAGPGWSQAKPKKTQHHTSDTTTTTTTSTDKTTHTTKKPIAGAASQKAKKDKVPSELLNAVITCIREPLVDMLLNGSSLSLTYNGKSLTSMNDIPDAYLVTGSVEYKAFYDHCVKNKCLADFMCIIQVNELQTCHAGNYDKFMKGLYDIWMTRIDSGGSDPNYIPKTKHKSKEDGMVNLEVKYKKTLRGFIDKYWDSATSMPKKLSDVM